LAAAASAVGGGAGEEVVAMPPSPSPTPTRRCGARARIPSLPVQVTLQWSPAAAAAGAQEIDFICELLLAKAKPKFFSDKTHP